MIMLGFKLTYCPNCRRLTAHDIYSSDAGYLHSMCTEDGYDICSSTEILSITGEGNKLCGNCRVNTEHIRYNSVSGYFHWFCCSCGKDVPSGASEDLY
jgi:hypothetical protein